MSTGMGGTNAHVVLEEAPEPGVSTHAGSPHLLILSARTATALDRATLRLRDFLTRHDSVNLSDVAHTLRIGRKAFPHRRYLVCADREDAVSVLQQENSKRVLSNRTDESRRLNRRTHGPDTEWPCRCLSSNHGRGCACTTGYCGADSSL